MPEPERAYISTLLVRPRDGWPNPAAVATARTWTPRNEWRGGWVSPYAANIQWDVYRNDAGRVLVKMLYNEKELAFKAGCSPIAVGSFFYDFGELKRCYGYPS